MRSDRLMSMVVSLDGNEFGFVSTGNRGRRYPQVEESGIKLCGFLTSRLKYVARLCQVDNCAMTAIIRLTPKPGQQLADSYLKTISVQIDVHDGEPGAWVNGIPIKDIEGIIVPGYFRTKLQHVIDVCGNREPTVVHTATS